MYIMYIVYNSYFDYVESLFKKFHSAIFLMFRGFNLPSANFTNTY